MGGPARQAKVRNSSKKQPLKPGDRKKDRQKLAWPEKYMKRLNTHMAKKR
jgi:hypothetical protein